MIGAHLSIAGGLANALHEAARLKLDCVQVFTKNQRQWRVPPLDPGQAADWREALASMGWDAPDADRVVSHNSYLINLASPDPVLRRRSARLHRTELERCEALGIRCCVAHPGSHGGEGHPRDTPLPLGEPPGRDERAGLRRIAGALNRIHRDLGGYRAVTCLETTVGAGTQLGYDFGHLAWLREHVEEPHRIAFCLDTCHVTAAGHDMTTPARAAAVLRRFDETCGLDHLRVMHLNDSKGGVGSRLDRHDHIGLGTCGLACFRTIMNHPALRGVPKVLETPKGDNDRGVAWDIANARRLKRLIRRADPSR